MGRRSKLNRKVKLSVFAGLILLLLFAIECKKSKPITDWLAKVDEQIITPEEFRLFYELDPNFGLDSTGLPALKAELDKYIDQKLALRLAEKQQLLDDPVIQKAFNWELRQAMLRALFRKEVSSKIKITDQELRKAYLTQNEMAHVQHLFTTEKDQANAWYQKLQKDSSLFKVLAAQAFRDTLLARTGGDLGWVKLSDLDDEFVQGIEALPVGQISKPIQTRWGYHIVRVLNRKKPAIIREDEFLKQRPSLEKWLRRKKSLEQSRIYISQTIGRINPQPDKKLFMKIWFVIQNSGPEKLQLQAPKLLDDRLIQKLKNALNGDLNVPFIHFKGGSVSLGEFLALLEQIPQTQRPRFKTPKDFSNQLAKIFRDDFLFKKAEKLGLENDPQVQKEWQRFKEEQLYYYFVQQITDTLKVPDAVAHYFKTKASKIPADFPEVSRFNTLQEWRWFNAEQRLHQQLRAQKPKIEINLEKLRKENKRINWDRRIRMFMIRKPS